MKLFDLLSNRLRLLLSSSLFKRLTIYSSGAGISQVLMMVYAVIVARHLGPESFGLFAGNYAFAGITIFLVNWGMDTWMLRESGLQGAPRLLSSTVLQTKLTMGMVWALLLILVAPCVRPALFPFSLILVVAIDQLGESCLTTLVSGLNIEHRTAQASWVLLLTRSGRLLSAVLLILLDISSPLLFSVFRGCATLTGLGLGLYFLRPAWQSANLRRVTNTLRSSFSYGIPELLSLLYAQADVTLMGFLSTKVAVGEYSPAVSLVNSLFIIPTSIFYILIPILTNTYNNRLAQFQAEIRKMAVLYLVIGLVSSLATGFIVSPLLAVLLGSKYQITGYLVWILSPLLLFKSFSYACITYLVVVGWQAKRIGVQIVSAGINIGLNLIFIPIYGPVGAAAIYVLSEFALAAGYGLFAARHYRSFYRRTKLA